MDENYLAMMRQTLKASRLSEAQIEQTLEAQKAAMQMYGNMDPAVLQQAAAGMEGYMKNMAAAFGDAAANGGSYFEFTEKPSINKSYQWAVACGADLIHLRGDIINDLGTGTDRETVLEILSAQWGIENKKDFIEMAESLKRGRHSAIYHKLAAGEAVEGFEEEADNLKQAAALFKKDKLIAKNVPDMLIWDLGRLINISRFAFDGKLITRTEALGYLKEAALLVKEHYASWKDLSVAYQFGRAVWGGPDDDDYEELKDGMEQLLTEEDSPWVTLPFDMELDFDG